MRLRFKQNASSGIRIRVRLKRKYIVCSALQLQLHDPVADMLDHRQVMGNEEEAEVSLLLQFFEQMDDVSVQADIQRGNRFRACRDSENIVSDFSCEKCGCSQFPNNR